MISKGVYSDETALLRAFKFTDLSDTGYINPECFLRALTKLGINLVNSENVSDYFNLYDKDRSGKINYRELITEIFTPLEMKRRKIMKEEKEFQENTKNVEKGKFNIISSKFRQKIEQNLENNTKTINKIKKEILSQGANILFDIEKTLKKIDVDNSGMVNIDEFNRIFAENGINLTPDDIKIIFGCFDPSRNGKIYYKDFMGIIIENLNEFRQKVIEDIFNKLTKNERGNIEPKNFFNSINTRKISKDNLDEFKCNFLINHDYFNRDINETTFDEFLYFFKIISMDFDDDSKFEEYINNIIKWRMLKKQEKIQKHENLEENTQFLNSFEKLKNLIIKLGSSGIIELIKNFKVIDPSNSNKLDFEEFTQVLENTLKDEIKIFTLEEIQSIFDIYDIKSENIMNFPKFLSDLLEMNSMTNERKEHLKKIFDHIDYEGKHTVDINELITYYKKPSEDMDDPVPDLIDSLMIYHNIGRPNRNPLITADELIKFYNYINILIPETKNDKLFIDYTSYTWPLSDKSFEERKNMIKISGEGLGKQKNRDAMNKLYKSQKAPFGTIKDKINYNLNDKNATFKYDVNKIEDILTHLRNDLIQKGYIGILSMRRTFMLVDEKSSKKIPFDEFEKLFKKYKFNLSDVEIKNLFNFFDKNNTGFINYDEFVNHVCGELNAFRKDILKKVFVSLDKDEKGFITVGQIRKGYNPSEHPLVRRGKRCEDEILAEFLDVLEYHFNLLVEKNEENVDINEVCVDFDEFCQFYKNISVCIEDDKYFEIMLLSEWGIKKDGKSLYQRTWNKQDL